MQYSTRHKTVWLTAILIIVTAISAYATHGDTGNGAPNGSHYTLNIIGVPKGKQVDMTGTQGHTIFVWLNGNSKIWLCEAGVDDACEEVDDFAVLDRNATDNDGALFALPNPDLDDDGTTVYSVFARALGTPGGSSITTTCATDPDTGEEICSVSSLELVRDREGSRFDNVSKYLLYIYVDVDGDGTLERVSLFDDDLEGYFWDYNNSGLRLVQLRFYACSTNVPDPDNPDDPQDDADCFSGTH